MQERIIMGWGIKKQKIKWKASIFIKLVRRGMTSGDRYDSTER